MIKLVVPPNDPIGSKNRVLPIGNKILQANGLWLIHLTHFAKSYLNPPLPSLTEHGLKMALKERAGVLDVPLGVGFGGGEARKRFVEQGDDSLLLGER